MSDVVTRNLTSLCEQLGDEVADPITGFVSVRDLLTRFRAKAIFRPLLVEAMFGSLDDGDEADWAILIDSETHAATSSDLAAECYSSPLSPRLRNTIAHELVHSISFRREEFGVRFTADTRKRKKDQTLVDQIEQETESLSPHVLLPATALQKAFSQLDGPVSSDYLRTVCRSHGVSPWVLINRLRAVPLSSGPRLLPALRNIGIGLFQKRKGNFSSIVGWPLFTNFDNAITPKFLLDLRQSNSLRSTDALPSDNFLMNGGSESQLHAQLDAGTPNLPRSHSGHYEIQTETREVASDTHSIFIVRKLS